MNINFLKILKFSAIFFVAGFLFFSDAHSVSAAGCISQTSGNWNNEATWTDASCGAGHYPGQGGASDSAAITDGHTVTLNVDTTITGLTICDASCANDTTLDWAANTNTLTINGAVTVNGGSGPNDDVDWFINAGTVTISGAITFDPQSGTASRYAKITVTSGALNANGGVIWEDTSGEEDTQLISFTSGTVTIGGAHSFTCGTVENVTTAGTLVYTGTFNFSNSAVGCLGVMNTISGTTVKFGNNITATNDAFTLGAGSIAEFTGNSTVTPTRPITFGDLTITSGTVTLAGDITVAGSWTNNSSITALTGNSSVFFSGTSKTIGGSFLTPFYNLNISAGASTTLNTNATVANTFSISSDSATVATTFSHASGIDLTVSGSTSIYQPASNSLTTNWDIGAGTATVAGGITLQNTTTTTSRIAKITLASGGILNANTNISTGLGTGTSTPEIHVIDISAGGTINLLGGLRFGVTAGASGFTFENTTCAGGGGTFNYAGTSAQIVYMPGLGGYCNLKINNTAGATLDADITTSNVKENITVGDDATAAIFENAGLAIAGNSGKTFLVNNLATFKLTGSTENLPSTFTSTYDSNSTIEFNQTSPISLTLGQTYGNVSFKPASGSITFTLPTAITINGDLTVGGGAATSTIVTADTNDPALTPYNLIVKDNSTFIASSSSLLTVTLDLIVGEGGSGIFTANGGAIDIWRNLSIYSGAIWNKHVSTITSFKNGGVFASVNDNTTPLQDLGAVQVSSNGGNTTLSTNSSIKVTSLTVNASQNLDISSDVLTITGSGTPFVFSGTTFTTTGSTVDYSSASSPTIANLTYNNLTISGTINAVTASATVTGLFNVSGTFTPNAGTITMSGTAWTFSGSPTFYNLTIAGTPATQPSNSFNVGGTLTVNSTKTLAPTAGTITMNASSTITNSGTALTFNNLTIAGTGVTATGDIGVTGNFLVNAASGFTSTSGTLSIGGNFTNTPGTTTGFAHNNGTVNWTGAVQHLITGTTTFYTFTDTVPNSTLKFINGTTYTFAGPANSVTVTGTSGNNITITSDTTDQWLASFTNTQNTLTYITLSHSGCNSSAVVSMDGTSTNDPTSVANDGTCWGFSTPITISGNVYTDEAASPTKWLGAGKCDASASVIKISVDGGAPTSGTCGATNADFSINVSAGGSNVIAVFMDHATDKGVLYVKAAASPVNISGLVLTKDRITIDNSSNITNANINKYDQSNDAKIPVASDGTNITGDSGYELLIRSGSTLTPGGNVSVSAAHVVGTYTGSTETLTLSGGGTTACASAAVPGTTEPLCVAGTFTAPTNTNFTGATATRIASGTYTNLGVKPGANSITHTLGSGTFTVSGNITLGNGTNNSVVVNGSTNNPTITTTGGSSVINISANTQFIPGTGTMTLSGNGTPLVFSTTFGALSQTSRRWRGLTAAPNGNVYGADYGGDIYMQTNGSGTFNPLGQTSRLWIGMAAAPNGNVYAAVQNGDIYMQTGGTGAFSALSQTTRTWYGMAAAPNGNVYAAVSSGDIYMQTNGTGDFNPLSQTSRSWRGLAAAPNGNVYAAVSSGDIYMQTNGTGNFNALSQTIRLWDVMAAAPNGNVYAAVNSGDIYMQTGSIGNFVALSQTSRIWESMAASPDGNVYAGVQNSDIYMQDNDAGTVTYSNAGATITNTTFNNLTISAPITASTTATVGGVLTTSAAFAPSAGTITLNNGASISTSGNAPTFQGLTVASSSTVTTSSNFSISGALTVPSTSTFTASGGTITLSAVGFTIGASPGTINLAGLTVAQTPTAQPSANMTLSGTLTVNSTKTFSPTGTIILTNGAALSNSGTLLSFNNLTIAEAATVTGNTSYTVTGALTNGPTATFTSNSGTVTMNNGSSIVNSGTQLTFNNLTIDTGATVTANTDYTVAGILTVNSTGVLSPTSGTVTFNNGASLVNSGTLLSFNNLTTAGGATVTGNTSYAVKGVLTNGSTATFTSNSGTVTMGNGSSIVNSGTQLTFNNLTIDTGATVTANTDYTVAGILTVSSTGVLSPTSGTIILSGTGTPLSVSGTFTPSGTNLVSYTNATSANLSATTYNNLTLGSGTYTAPAGNLTLTGNLTNSGTFAHGSGTVVLTPAGAGTTIEGSNGIGFNNFTMSAVNGAGKYLKFKDGNTYTFAGAFDVAGKSGNILALSSTTTDNKWFTTFNSTATVAYLSLKDSGCTGGNDITPSVTMTDLGNNDSCWRFISRRGGGGGVEASATPDAPVGGGGQGGDPGGDVEEPDAPPDTPGTGGAGGGAGGGDSGFLYSKSNLAFVGEFPIDIDNIFKHLFAFLW